MEKKRKLVRGKKTCEENLNNDLKLVAWLWAYRLFYQNSVYHEAIRYQKGEWCWKSFQYCKLGDRIRFSYKGSFFLVLTSQLLP